jgi:hypothetical protein
LQINLIIKFLKYETCTTSGAKVYAFARTTRESRVSLMAKAKRRRSGFQIGHKPHIHCKIKTESQMLVENPNIEVDPFNSNALVQTWTLEGLLNKKKDLVRLIFR